MSSSESPMTKEAVDAAVTSLEAWGRSVDNWVLIFAALVAVALTFEVIFSVLHWKNENTLRPLRAEQARLNALQIATLENETAQLRQLAGPRTLNHDVFVKELEGKPKPKSVAIWYLPD